MTTREQIIAAAKESEAIRGLLKNRWVFTDESHLEHFYAIAFAAGAASRDAEVAELVAQQCTSPFADSPPCRGIQRERDTITELVAALEAIEGGDGAEWMSACASEALAKVRKP